MDAAAVERHMTDCRRQMLIDTHCHLDFPELAARMTQRTAVLDWHARQMELMAD